MEASQTGTFKASELDRLQLVTVRGDSSGHSQEYAASRALQGFRFMTFQHVATSAVGVVRGSNGAARSGKRVWSEASSDVELRLQQQADALEQYACVQIQQGGQAKQLSTVFEKFNAAMDSLMEQVRELQEAQEEQQRRQEEQHAAFMKWASGFMKEQAAFRASMLEQMARVQVALEEGQRSMKAIINWLVVGMQQRVQRAIPLVTMEAAVMGFTIPEPSVDGASEGRHERRRRCYGPRGTACYSWASSLTVLLCLGVRAGKAWNAFMRAVHGNTPPPPIVTTRATWAEALGMAGGDVQRTERAAGSGGNQQQLEISSSQSGPLVLAWNARKLAADPRSAGAREKWQRVEEAMPSAPLLLWLFEVAGDMQDMRQARRWFKQRGYEIRFLTGEGGSGREIGEDGNRTNGIIVALRMRAARFVEYRRLHERVMGVKVAMRGPGGATLNFCGLHGMHKARPGRSFAMQMGAVEQWMQAYGGGVLSADFNFIPCARWREALVRSEQAEGRTRMNGNDKVLRLACAWSCACCWADGDGGGAGSMRTEVVAGADGSISWTRRDREHRSKLDWSIAYGLEVGKWTAGVPQFQQRDGMDISDHAMVSLQRQSLERPAIREARPRAALPLKGKLAGDAQRRYGWEVRARGTAGELAAKVEHALEQGASACEAVTLTLVDLAREAASACARGTGAKAPARSLYNSCRKQLSTLLDLQRSGADLFSVHCPTLFGRRAPFGGLRERMRGHTELALVRAMFKHLRRQVRRTGAMARKALAARDNKLKAMAHSIVDRANMSQLADFQRAWQMIKEKSESVAFDRVFPNDDPGTAAAPNVPISCNDPTFPAELAAIGENIVKEMASTPPVKEAYKAWCKKFMPQFEELTGSDGRPWELARELYSRGIHSWRCWRKCKRARLWALTDSRLNCC